jgi:hypothetical protein
MKNDTSGPAFPLSLNKTWYAGMTLRDYFAAKAMQGLIVGTSMWTEDEDDSEISECAYAIADAMLKARKK